MDKYKKLENITNGIYAANKLRLLRDSHNSDNTRSGTPAGNVDILRDSLQVITEYSPNTHRNTLENAVGKSSAYIDTYRNLKSHLRATRNQQFRSDDFMKTLSMMEPVLNTNQKRMLQKILKIYEAFNS